MKNRIISMIIFIVALVSVVSACFINNYIPSKQLELTYYTNGGVPYKWEYQIEDESVVGFVESYEIDNKNKNGIVGAPISINYVFKGLKKGTTTITFKYVNITDGTIEKEEKHNIKVDKNKNISLVVNSLFL